jgi:hypothetical protein
MKMHKLNLLLALLAAALAVSCSDAASGGGGGAIIRTQLTRADAGRSLTRRQQLRRMALRSKARAAQLLSLSGSSSSPSASAMPGKGQPLGTEYLISFSIGTPLQPVQVTLDTGSDLVWTQCQPCPSCYAQALPYYEPNLSATSAEIACDAPACQQLDLSSCGTHKWGNRTCVYTYFYGDRQVCDERPTRRGHARSTTTPATRPSCPASPSGAASSTTGSSAPTRPAAASPASAAAPCPCRRSLRPTTSPTVSPTSRGPPPVPSCSACRRTSMATPVVTAPLCFAVPWSSRKGIRVGSTRLPVPESAFALKGNGSGGTIIDSGTSVTQLPPLVYGLLHDAFVAQVDLPVTNDEPLCFAVPSSSRKKHQLPKLELEFEGATLDLPRENYVFEIEEGGQSNMCIAVASSGGT